MTAATADASAVRSVGLYCRSPVVSRARCLQAAIQATALQFVTSGSAPSAPSPPLCCTVVAVLSGGPCCSPSGPCPGKRAGGTGCGKPCAPRRSGCVWYGFCRRWSGAPRGRKRSWCRYQWPSAADGLRSVSHCSATLTFGVKKTISRVISSIFQRFDFLNRNTFREITGFTPCWLHFLFFFSSLRFVSSIGSIAPPWPLVRTFTKVLFMQQ